ncbi:MAG: DUF1905 domain-containing protein [Saprospiraceae bacterium]|jgi:hypothetical protein|nr:DUF1905 domain-containing protein [Saprospiraceae bacterium]
MHTFTARITEVAVNTVWLVIYVPMDVEATFGAKSGVDVRGTIDGLPYQRSLISDGNGSHFIVTNLAMRKQLGKTTGDEVLVTMERDDTYKEVTLPDYFVDELAQHPRAQAAYDKAPPSSKRWVVSFLNEPKSDAAKVNRVFKVIEVLERWGKK